MILHDLIICVVLGFWYGTARHETLWNGSRRVVLGPLRLILPFLGASWRFSGSLLFSIHHGLDENEKSRFGSDRFHLDALNKTTETKAKRGGDEKKQRLSNRKLENLYLSQCFASLLGLPPRA